jgi:folate-binding protein YgfZ
MTRYSPDWSVVRVTGPDAASFLHNLCTNDIKRLEVGGACEAFFTDVKAHVLAHAVVCRAADGYRVVVTSPRAAELAAHLDRYHIREKLELAVEESPRVVLYFDGPQTRDNVFEVAALSAGLSLGESPDEQAPQLSEEGFQQLRIEQGFPLDHVDVDASRLPQEANRDALAISFTKGCYLGQETVARIDALGHVNRKLVSVQFEGPEIPASGTALLAGDKEVGAVTSACWSAKLTAPLALAYVRRESNAAGTELVSAVGRGTVLPGNE